MTTKLTALEAEHLVDEIESHDLRGFVRGGTAGHEGKRPS